MKWGAKIFEFHIDLDQDGAEYASGHCWLPDELCSYKTLGSKVLADGIPEKKPGITESKDRDWRRPFRWS